MESKQDQKQVAPQLLGQIQMSVHFNVPPNMPALSAQNAVVQMGEDEALISFFNVIPPMIPDASPESLERAQREGAIGLCVARIVMSRKRFLEFVGAAQQIALAMAPKTEEEAPAE
jgi:hypothetical protein